MSYVEKIERKIKSLYRDDTIPFSEAKVEGVSTDTLRKVLHRLHDKGTIFIAKRGYFKKKNLLVSYSLYTKRF